MFRSIIMNASLVSALLCAGTASAQTVTRLGVADSVTVRSDDLALDTARGQATLKIRVARAIDRVCGDTGNRELSMRMASRDCSRIARADSAVRLASAINAARAPRYAAVGR